MWEIKHRFITLSIQWNQLTEFIAEYRALLELGRTEAILKCAKGKKAWKKPELEFSIIGLKASRKGIS